MHPHVESSATTMTVHHARPGSRDTNPNVVLVVADRYRGYPARPWYQPVYRVTDLVDAQHIRGTYDLAPQ
jgi:hypothetical protein